MRFLGIICLALVVGGCDKPEPLAPDAPLDALNDACEAGDLDACTAAARRRSSQYEAAMGAG